MAKTQLVGRWWFKNGTYVDTDWEPHMIGYIVQWPFRVAFPDLAGLEIFEREVANG